MSTCTVCDCHSNISVKLPSYVPDKKLAFIENVCLRLIEDRFGPFYFAEPWPETQPKTTSPFSGGLARRLLRQHRNAGKPATALVSVDGECGQYDVSTGNSVTGALQSAIPQIYIDHHESRSNLVRSRGSPIFDL